MRTNAQNKDPGRGFLIAAGIDLWFMRAHLSGQYEWRADLVDCLVRRNFYLADGSGQLRTSVQWKQIKRMTPGREFKKGL